MKSTLNQYREVVADLLRTASQLDIPYQGLLAHKKEIEWRLVQEQCAHELEAKTIGKKRYWQCKKCNKIIYYECFK